MEPSARSGGNPSLVLLSSEGAPDGRIDLTQERVAVGRAPGSDIQLDDIHVSRTHAALWQRGGSYVLQDLGSSGGTSVNGSALVQPRELHPGDVVAFATVRMRYEDPAVSATRVDLTAPQPAPVLAPPTGPTTYDVGAQTADVVNNVGHDQYNTYVHQVQQQRESFLRDVAATKTKARWLVWGGLLFLVIGAGLSASSVLGLMNVISTATETDPSTFQPFGNKILGMPSAFLGGVVSTAGSFMIVIGIVLHVVATSRRKHADVQFHVPPPWGSTPH